MAGEHRVLSFTCSLLISLSASMCSFLSLSISSRSSASDRDGCEHTNNKLYSMKVLGSIPTLGGRLRVEFALSSCVCFLPHSQTQFQSVPLTRTDEDLDLALRCCTVAAL